MNWPEVFDVRWTGTTEEVHALKSRAEADVRAALGETVRELANGTKPGEVIQLHELRRAAVNALLEEGPERWTASPEHEPLFRLLVWRELERHKGG